MACYNRDSSDNAIRILKAELLENNAYVEYVIEVGLSDYQWTVRHRYSEFHELNEILVSNHGLDKKLLPPKKTFGNTSESFIQKRRVALERYLDSLLRKFDRLPYELATFLKFQHYEINGLTQILAETLFNKGDTLLEQSSICLMDPLQLYAVTNRMTKPESVVSTQQRDIGHILDFATRLKRLKVVSAVKEVGTSNIKMNNLEYSLAIFKAITYLELTECDLTKLKGLDHLRKNLTKLKIKRSVSSIQEFLTRRDVHWEPEGDGADGLNESLIWPELTSVDFSKSNLHELPEAMKYLVKVEYVDLHDNYIAEIRHLESSSYLTHIDLSLNKISAISDLHMRLGNIKSINLSGNYLETLTGFSKLYSLEYLDVSNNQISQVLELNHVGSLPLLEHLIVQGNSVTVIPDYRIQVFKIFEGRAKELSLDNVKATEQELSTVAVLMALDRAKRPSSNSLQRQSDEGAGTSTQGAETSAQEATAESRLTDLNTNSTKVLDSSALTDKLEHLDQQAEQTNSSTAAVNIRFDSPFNSPTRSSFESDQHFHSVGSTPKDPASSAHSDISGTSAGPSSVTHESSQQVEGSDRGVINPSTENAENHSAYPKTDSAENRLNRDHEEQADSCSDSASEISSPSASFSVNSDAADGDDEDEDESVMADSAKEDSLVVDTAKEDSLVVDTAKENSMVVDTAKEDSMVVDTAKEDNVVVDTAKEDSVVVDTAKEDNVVVDTAKEDNVVVDTTKEDSVVMDTAKEDNVVVDTAKEDRVVVDTAKEDSVVLDTAKEDSVVVDTAKEDSVVVDAAKEDSVVVNTAKEDSVVVDAAEENISVVDTTGKKKHKGSCEDVTGDVIHATSLLTPMQVCGNPEMTCSASPVNVSIDVVDHLEQCLANIPKTIQLVGTLQRLTQMDGEELLNLFYHGAVITQAGDSKEELCHAMWTNLIKYNTADPEQPCLVLLSNQATYFITAKSEDDRYNVGNIRHENLEEVCIGPYHQYVRLGGSTTSDYYCCVTRDPSLVHIFITRVTFIVDTDFAKAPQADLELNADSEEEVSIYDVPEDSAEQTDHPSGVRFIHDEEGSLESIRNFIVDCCKSDESDVKPVSIDLVHSKADSQLLPLTLCLTETALYFVKESYADHPVPKCCHENLNRQAYAMDRSINLTDVSNVSLQEQTLTLDVMIKESETLSVVFCSLAMAQSFLMKCSQLLTN
ncbi:nischarin-like [Watersipora subatra]|uniref:nischarin-like n=1 Tax=Watersipora subatra TaxID=2589382 RepID=UPI00355C8322